MKSLRSHVVHCHHGFDVKKVKRTPEERKARRAATYRKQYEKKKAKKGSQRPRVCKKRAARDSITVDDMSEGYGIHGHKNCILESKESTIPSGGYGVFVKSKVHAGDFLTEYSGQYSKSWPHPPDKRYTIGLPNNGGWIVGIRSAKKQHGYGSLVNRVDKFKDKNCEFVHEKNRMFLKAIKNIKAGTELLTTYGHGVRILKQ
ncbi:hypothetical protein DYB28_001670 [Aphanomyces astaci]|uniref:SET domain-containing protein n=1 Tax=Aphanomyces astaci TaxID=112090 RepID=A0A397D2S5_APHAT|nr:hypothetical protein DYB25_005622 [Aphanomyces astaci]RHY14116.1 hypothetical protein DYB36_009330 [Aphanomyces astaci]RHY51927.1 hypothetical protein DYB34_004340 [Aphanomyces astaci]RHY57681.1 hypothetical protein DYB38_006086 [Aphanomyces astaci]RHY65298.1 hypothetical protein DYB30_006641 [Aphanomyces astaci]